MSKIAVVYWSGTGNTEAMASAVADGIKEAGAEAVVMTSDVGYDNPSKFAAAFKEIFGMTPAEYRNDRR